MIRSFRHRGLKRLYEHGDGRRISADHLHRVERILTILDAATSPQALNVPGYDLHSLRGNLKGFYSVRVSGNWRIVFRFDEEPEDVDLVDYH